MKLFDTVYLRLTGWYVLIIMGISIIFSLWVYNQARNELLFGLTRAVPAHSQVIEGEAGVQITGPFNTAFDIDVNDSLEASRRRLIVRLVGLNVAVLVVGAVGSYWLARRTMKPIEDSVEAQHRFTADASHELRTPLAAMKTEIEVGLRDKNLSKAEAVTLLKSNLEEIDRLGNLADGLLALTQHDSTSEPVPTSLEEVAAKVAKRLHSLAEAKHIELKRDLKPVIVSTDEASVDKIIGILLDNAIKYSPEKTKVTIATYQKDGHGYAVITDEGVGIKATELPHIFDRFYRADSSRSKSHVAGHGLGLSIARQLAEQLNGSVMAASKPGKGSTFTLKIPIAP